MPDWSIDVPKPDVDALLASLLRGDVLCHDLSTHTDAPDVFRQVEAQLLAKRLPVVKLMVGSQLVICVLPPDQLERWMMPILKRFRFNAPTDYR